MVSALSFPVANSYAGDPARIIWRYWDDDGVARRRRSLGRIYDALGEEASLAIRNTSESVGTWMYQRGPGRASFDEGCNRARFALFVLPFMLMVTFALYKSAKLLFHAAQTKHYDQFIPISFHSHD